MKTDWPVLLLFLVDSVCSSNYHEDTAAHDKVKRVKFISSPTSYGKSVDSRFHVARNSVYPTLEKGVVARDTKVDSMITYNTPLINPAKDSKGARHFNLTTRSTVPSLVPLWNKEKLTSKVTSYAAKEKARTRADNRTSVKVDPIKTGKKIDTKPESKKILQTKAALKYQKTTTTPKADTGYKFKKSERAPMLGTDPRYQKHRGIAIRSKHWNKDNKQPESPYFSRSHAQVKPQSNVNFRNSMSYTYDIFNPSNTNKQHKTTNLNKPTFHQMQPRHANIANTMKPKTLVHRNVMSNFESKFHDRKVPANSNNHAIYASNYIVW